MASLKHLCKTTLLRHNQPEGHILPKELQEFVFAEGEDCDYFAAMGHLCNLKIAHENGCEWDVWTCAAAASAGQLECLKYLHENGCEWNIMTCDHAAKYGHLDCLKYAHEHGCPWSYSTCREAVRYSHLDCLRYAHENGCPWDADLYDIAASRPGMDGCAR
jgi:hypothetical protein